MILRAKNLNLEILGRAYFEKEYYKRERHFFFLLFPLKTGTELFALHMPKILNFHCTRIKKIISPTSSPKFGEKVFGFRVEFIGGTGQYKLALFYYCIIILLQKKRTAK